MFARYGMRTWAHVAGMFSKVSSDTEGSISILLTGSLAADGHVEENLFGDLALKDAV